MVKATFERRVMSVLKKTPISALGLPRRSLAPLADEVAYGARRPLKLSPVRKHTCMPKHLCVGILVCRSTSCVGTSLDFYVVLKKLRVGLPALIS